VARPFEPAPSLESGGICRGSDVAVRVRGQMDQGVRHAVAASPVAEPDARAVFEPAGEGGGLEVAEAGGRLSFQEPGGSTAPAVEEAAEPRGRIHGAPTDIREDGSSDDIDERAVVVGCLHMRRGG